MQSPYEMKLNTVIKQYQLIRGTSGGDTLEKILLDLEGNGPIGGLLFTLDNHGFQLVIDMLVEFTKSGRSTAFNSLHEKARAVVANTDG